MNRDYSSNVYSFQNGTSHLEIINIIPKFDQISKISENCEITQNFKDDEILQFEKSTKIFEFIIFLI